MKLVALIAASRDARAPASLMAMLPLAGRVVLERQIRLADQAGAAPIILLVERLPDDLAVEIDRLRREGWPLRIARTPAEAAATIGAEDRVLLLADGAVSDPAQVERLLECDDAAVLTVADAGFGETYERIDASSRWAGLAVCPGEIAIDTAMMLRDWDFVSTLLRRILQSGAVTLAAASHLAIVADEAAAAAFERQLITDAWQSKGSWASHLLAPAERGLPRAVLGSRIGPHTLGSLAALLAGAGAALLALGWPSTGFTLLLLATPVEGGAQRLAHRRMEETVSCWWALLLPLLAVAGLIGLANAMLADLGW
ncbi:MAG: hypothetical protein ACT4OE_02745, partial [Sphingosinicella sp.]